VVGILVNEGCAGLFKRGQPIGISAALPLFPICSLIDAVTDAEKLTPADPQLVDSIAFGLRFSGRKRVHDADAFMAKIAAHRIVRHLEKARYVVMKKPPLGGHSAVGRGFDG
jgi:hypothetical protein